MYIISRGSVDIIYEDNRITTLKTDDFFGEIVLVEDRGVRTATAMAKEDTQLIGFFKPDLIQIMNQQPEIGVKNLLVSLFIAFVGFFLLKPFFDFLERQGVSRLISTLFPFLFFSLALFGASLLVFPTLGSQFDELRAELPKYVQGAQKMLQGLESGVLIAVVNQETGAVTAYVTFIHWPKF